MLNDIGIQEQPINSLLSKIKGLKKLHKNQRKFQPLIPMTLKGGYIDITGQGIANETTDVQDATTFKRVFTGQSTAIAQWDNSIKLRNDGKGNILREFQTGHIQWAIGFAMGSASEISDYTQEVSFKELHDIETISLLVPAEDFREDTHYKVYMLPRLTQRLLRIKNITRYHNTDGEVVYSSIELTSINDEISKTGIATTNYIQRSGVGQPYSHPVWDEADKKITHQVKGTGGVNGVQIELIGNLAISSLLCFGRKYETGVIHPPKPILMHKSKPDVPTPLVRAGSPTRNLRFLRDCQFNIATGWTDWKEPIKNQYDMTQQKWFQGMLKYNNSKSAKETFHADPVDIPRNYKLGVSTDLKAYGSPLIQDPRISNPNGGHEMSFGEILSSNALRQITLTQLTPSATQHMPISLRSIPLVGRVLSGLTLGIPLGTDRTKVMKTGTEFDAFMDAGTYDLISTTKYPNKGLMDATEFDNTDANPVGDVFGSKANRIAIRFSLTDKFRNLQDIDSGLGFPVDTIENLDTLQMGEDKAWGGKSSTLDTTNTFEIDKLITHIFGKGEYIVSYFKDDNKLYTSRYITTAKYLDDIKQLGNEISQGSLNGLPIEGDMKGINWPSFKKISEQATKPFELKLNAERPVYIHESTIDKYTIVEFVRGAEKISGQTNIVKGGTTTLSYDTKIKTIYTFRLWTGVIKLVMTKEGEYYKVEFKDNSTQYRDGSYVIVRFKG